MQAQENYFEKILVFKTDISNAYALMQVEPLFNELNSIQNWNVDQEDVDNVLRIETNQLISDLEIIEMLTNKGLAC